MDQSDQASLAADPLVNLGGAAAHGGAPRRPALRPGVFVLLGSTATLVGRRSKSLLSDLGAASAFRWCAIDSDNRIAAPDPSGRFADLGPGEVCLLGNAGPANVLAHPELHADVLRRFDLGEPDLRRRFEAAADAIGEDTSGCGQQRPLAALRLVTSWSMFVAQLEKCIAEVNDLWSALRSEIDGLPLEHEPSGMPIWIVTGPSTGSSLVVDVAAQVRRLVDSANIRVIALMPSVYDGKLSPRKRKQIKANAVAMIREVEYVQQGLARSDGLRLRYLDDPAPRDLPPRLFSQFTLVERTNARGMDLGSIDAVVDAVALSLVAECGISLGDAIRAEHVNHAAVELMQVCPQTGLRREYGTTAASAVSVPRRELTRSIALSRALRIIESRVLGRETGSATACKEADDFLARCGITRTRGGAPEALVDALAARVEADVTRRVGSMFPGGLGGGSHLADRTFVPALDEFLQLWPGEQHLRRVRQDAAAAAERMTPDLVRALDAWIADAASRRGLRSAKALAAAAHAAFDTLATRSPELAAKAEREADEARARISFESARLRGFFGRIGTDKRVQERIRSNLLAMGESDVRAVLIHASQGALLSLRDKAKSHSERIGAAETNLASVPARIERNLAVARASTTSLFAGGRMDVSLVTEEDVDRMAGEAGGGDESVIADAARKLGRDMVGAAADREFAQSVLDLCIPQVRRALEGLNVARTFYEKLRDPGQAQRARAILREAIVACAPLWRAQSPAAQPYPETLVIAVPADRDSPEWRAIEEIVREVEAATRDPRYECAGVTMVGCEDASRIYVVRRTNGARPHHLLCWKDLQSAYEHCAGPSSALPIHVFSKDIVSRMPSLSPGRAGGKES